MRSSRTLTRRALYIQFAFRRAETRRAQAVRAAKPFIDETVTPY
jgi:hypothetical protein